MRALIDFPGADARCLHAFDVPQCVLQAEQPGNVPAILTKAYEHARSGAWVLGFVAYEAATAFDPAMPVRAPMPGLPLAWFGVFARPQAASGGASGPAPARYRVDREWSGLDTREQALSAMTRIRESIARGAVYQVNLTTRLRAGFAGDARAYFDDLRRAQPDGYGLFLDTGPWQLLSVSPEMFFDWTPEGELTARPMKGTAPRHADARRDAAEMRRMLASAKERAENLMIVDLLRNDLSRVAVPGTVEVPALFTAEPLPTAWQMTSTIRCRSRAGLGLADIFGALFPCGSVTGAPKIAAMAAIAQLEAAPRGVYCGALGVIRPGGHATFSVGIRTVMIDAVQGRAECGIGSGVTWDSTGAAEWDEWQVKQRFLARAIQP